MGMFNKKIGKWELFLSYFPLTYNGILRSMVGNNFKTILDVGCGTGLPMEIINYKKLYTATGVDIYDPYLKECKLKNVYTKLINSDIRKLPFKEKSFDVVICFHVIEHLTKKEGDDLIRKLEKIAKKRVVLAMPIGYLHQEEYDGNQHQAHKSQWYPKDLREKGYMVTGQGLRVLYKEENVVVKYGIFSNILFLISMLFQPLLMYKPENAIYMFAMKDIRD